MNRGLVLVPSGHEKGMPMTTGWEDLNGKAVGGIEPDDTNVTDGGLVIVPLTLGELADISDPPLVSSVLLLGTEGSKDPMLEPVDAKKSEAMGLFKALKLAGASALGVTVVVVV
jgi:hypothetical protein